MSRKPAVFLDRDGALIGDTGIPEKPQDITISTDTAKSLLRLQENYSLFVVTNQSRVSCGGRIREEVNCINNNLEAMLKEKGVDIKKWYIAPYYREESCNYIKLNPSFLLTAAEEFNLSLDKSFFIGDHPRDVAIGDMEGVFGLYVLTRHGRNHLRDLPLNKLLFHKLRDAVSWILEHPDAEMDIKRTIHAGAASVRKGSLVAFPTETVYGLGADALNPEAVANIFKAKKRPLHDPLIVHVSEKKQVIPLVSELSKKAKILMKYFWPGPLTLVFTKSDIVPDIVTAGNPTVAVRMPSNPIALEFIDLAGTAIAAPSANLFGYTSPTAADHVRVQLEGEYDILINGGACRVGVESTVLSLVNDYPVILRPGGVSIDEIQSMIGPVGTSSDSGTVDHDSPGMMPNHYATNTPLVVFSEIPEGLRESGDVGIMLPGPSEIDFAGPVEVLSETGDMRDAAVNLYAAMRRLDSMGLRMIATYRFPEYGLGIAVNDRLARASTGKI